MDGFVILVAAFAALVLFATLAVRDLSLIHI